MDFMNYEITSMKIRKGKTKICPGHVLVVEYLTSGAIESKNHVSKRWARAALPVCQLSTLGGITDIVKFAPNNILSGVQSMQ